MQIVDIIKYDGNDNNKQWLIYKYPSDEFVLGSQLIVNQGQEALFFRGGQALDLFGAGTHTLSTANLPLLNNFVKILFGGKTPFTAEVYFINKTVNLNMKWGTSTQIPYRRFKIWFNFEYNGAWSIWNNNKRFKIICFKDYRSNTIGNTKRFFVNFKIF